MNTPEEYNFQHGPMNDLDYLRERHYHVGVKTKAMMQAKGKIKIKAEDDCHKIMKEYYRQINEDYIKWKKTRTG